jgi:hypothetical protein
VLIACASIHVCTALRKPLARPSPRWTRHAFPRSAGQTPVLDLLLQKLLAAALDGGWMEADTLSQ